MGLPVPNLDDRTFELIVEEAKKLIPLYCPDWTDYNSSDPGIALIEIMAWMTEMMIYRINRTPEKNYVKFLELMGIRLQPAQAAETWVVFEIDADQKRERAPVIEKNTKVATEAINGDESSVFTTVRKMETNRGHLIKVLSVRGNEYCDHTPGVLPPTEKLPRNQYLQNSTINCVPLFKHFDNCVPHCLYLGDIHLSDKTGNEFLVVDIKLAALYPAGIPVECEYFDGSGWIPLLPSSDETCGLRNSGSIKYNILPSCKKTTVNNVESVWLRLRYTGIDADHGIKFSSVKYRMETSTERIQTPDDLLLCKAGLAGADVISFFTIDFNAPFYLFGKTPTQNDMLYLRSPMFGKAGAQITIYSSMSDSSGSPSLDQARDLELYWEYHSDDGDWKMLGVTSVTGVLNSISSFADETEAFSHSGRILFTCPDDIAPVRIYNRDGWWIRVRIAKGSYGNDSSKVPFLSKLSIGYTGPLKPFEHVFTYNDYVFEKNNVDGQDYFVPFVFRKERDPALLIAFSEEMVKDRVVNLLFLLTGNGPEERRSRVVWEYAAGDMWKRLSVRRDETGEFLYSGIIEFTVPDDIHSKTMYEMTGFWIRARWVSGECSQNLTIKKVYCNAVAVKQAQCIENEILGSSNGQDIYQKYTLRNRPVSPISLLIKKSEYSDNPANSNLQSETDEECVIIKAHGKDEVWVRWNEVDTFFDSGTRSKHYMLDYSTGTITFGDGHKGMIPPKGTGNIMCETYYTGGGEKGNVGAGTIKSMQGTIPGVKRVFNPVAASGGAECETIEQAKIRGPWYMQHRNRAVTLQDFEYLTLESSREVARVKTYSESGIIHVVIIPWVGTGKRVPGVKLVEKVRTYLDERRLVTTVVDIHGPDYVDITIDTEVIIIPEKIEQLASIINAVKSKINSFFDAINGGPEGTGWPMGRSVHISEIYYMLEGIDGIDYIKRVVLNDNTQNTKIKLERNQIPFVRTISVIEVSDYGNA